MPLSVTSMFYRGKPAARQANPKHDSVLGHRRNLPAKANLDEQDAKLAFQSHYLVLFLTRIR